jgi:FtsP/CotA-like multicopper oxidase with cupredoxin domain
MPYSLDDHGRPNILISTMAMHTQNLKSEPRTSLLVTGLLGGHEYVWHWHILEHEEHDMMRPLVIMP